MDNEFPHFAAGRIKFKSPILNFDKMPAPQVGIFDSPTVYVCVNTEWWSFILERVRVLVRPDAWLGDDAEKIRASQEIENFLAMANCENCSEFVTDIRVDADTGQLQKKVGGLWTNANGDGGDTTVINNIENINDILYPDPPSNTSISNVQKACNVATGIVEYVLARFDDSLDLIDATFDAIAAADSILLLFPPLYIIGDQVTDLVNEIIEASTSAIRAAMTVQLTEDIICYLQNAIDSDGRLTEANYADAIDSINDAITANDNFGLLVSLKTMFAAISKEAFISRGNLYQAENSVCPCGDCFINPDMQIPFSLEDARWVLHEGTYDPNTGIITSDPVTLKIDLIFCLVRAAVDDFNWSVSVGQEGLYPACLYDFKRVECEWQIPDEGGAVSFNHRSVTRHDVGSNRIHWNFQASSNIPKPWVTLEDDYDSPLNDAYYTRLIFESLNPLASIEVRNLKITVALP